MTLNIIDISSYQSNIHIASLGAALNGAICKVTESTSYVSSAFPNQYNQLVIEHKLRGLYHFAGSSTHKSIGNSVAEAHFFVDTIRVHIHDAVLMLDWEPYGYGMSPLEEINWVLAWTNEVYILTGVRPIIYMDFNHVNIWHGAHPTLAAEVAKTTSLMVAGGAHYNNVTGFAPPSESNINIPSYWHLFGWQYTSRGNLNGYQPIDLNAVYITAQEWEHFANPNIGTKPPVRVSPMHNHGVPSLIAKGTKHFFGSITGGTNSLGGANSDEKPFIKLLQQQLIYLGCVPGVHDIHSTWADGVFDSTRDLPGTGATSRAVATFQRKYMKGTRYFGQVWWDDWTKMATL